MGFKHLAIFDGMTSYNLLYVFVSLKCYKRIVLKLYLQLQNYLKNIPIFVYNFSMIDSFVVYVIRQGILFLLPFSLFLNKSFQSVLSTSVSSIWSSFRILFL